MNLEEIRRRLEEVRSGLRHLVGLETIDEQQSAAFDWLEAEDRWLTAQEAEATAEARRAEERERRREELRGALADGTARTSRGDGPTIINRVEPFADDDLRYVRPTELRDRALAAVGRDELTRHLDDGSKERVEALLRKGATRNYDPSILARMTLITEKPAYQRAFMKLVTQAQPVLTPEESRAIEEYRATMTTTAAEGGHGIPVFIDPSIILTDQGSSNAIRKISRVEVVTNNAWKGVSAAGMSWSFDAEGAEVSNDGVATTQPTVNVHTARGFIPYTIEIGGDYPGFASEMSMLLVSGYDELLSEKFAVGAGDGSNEPFGIITAIDATAGSELNPATDGELNAVDIRSVYKALPEKYRPRASWVMHQDVDNEITALGDDKLNTQTENLKTGYTDVLMRRPVYTNEYFPEFTGTTGDANILVFGDFSNYLIAQRLGMTVELIPHLFHTANNLPSGTRGWFAYARVGADSVNDAAFRLLQNT